MNITYNKRKKIIKKFAIHIKSRERSNEYGELVLLVGDGGVTSYKFGDVLGICPEAPIAKVLIKEKKYFLDGIGAIAAILKKSGLRSIVYCCSGVGPISLMQKKIFKKEKILFKHLSNTSERHIGMTHHVVAENQHMAHLIEMEAIAQSRRQNNDLFNKELKKSIKRSFVICVADHESLANNFRSVEILFDQLHEHNKFVIYDCKCGELISSKYIDLIKINQDQLARWFSISNDSDEAVINGARLVLEKTGAKYVLCTRRSKGMLLVESLASKTSVCLIRPVKKEFYDIISVGDVVTAALIYCLEKKQSVLIASCFAASIAEYALDRRSKKQYDISQVLNYNQ